MDLNELLNFGWNFASGISGLFDWFFQEQSMVDFLAVLPDDGSWLFTWLRNALENIEGFSFVPAELFFEVGIPSILGFIFLKWLFDLIP